MASGNGDAGGGGNQSAILTNLMQNLKSMDEVKLLVALYDTNHKDGVGSRWSQEEIELFYESKSNRNM